MNPTTSCYNSDAYDAQVEFDNVLEDNGDRQKRSGTCSKCQKRNTADVELIAREWQLVRLGL